MCYGFTLYVRFRYTCTFSLGTIQLPIKSIKKGELYVQCLSSQFYTCGNKDMHMRFNHSHNKTAE